MIQFFESAPSDKPFCLSVSFSVPHGSQNMSMHPWDKPANDNPKLAEHPIYGDLYRDIDFKIPAQTAEDPYKFVPKALMNQQGRIKTYIYDYSREGCREHHIRYYQMITGMDKAVGTLLEALQEKKVLENTIIIFASDHGLLMGEYGMGGKALLYDLATKIPCLIYDPRLPQTQRGRTINQLAVSIDVTSTILDYAGIEPPAEMQGQSLVPLVEGADIAWRDAVFLENLYTGRDTPFSEGIRKGKWKYIRMYDGVTPYREQDVDFSGRPPEFEQLFDLARDPQELDNLVTKMEGSEVLAKLRELCAEESIRLNQRRTEYMKSCSVTPRR